MNYVSQWKEPIWLRLLLLFCAKRSFYHTLPPNKERFFHKVLIYKNVNISYIFTHCFFAVHLCSPWKCIRKTWQLRSNLRVNSVENEKEKLLITTEYILTQSHIFRTSGLQFSVEQAGQIALHFTDTLKQTFSEELITHFLLRLPRFRYHQKNLAYIANCLTSSVLFVARWDKSCRSTKVRSYN